MSFGVGPESMAREVRWELCRRPSWERPREGAPLVAKRVYWPDVHAFPERPPSLFEDRGWVDRGVAEVGRPKRRPICPWPGHARDSCCIDLLGSGPEQVGDCLHDVGGHLDVLREEMDERRLALQREMGPRPGDENREDPDEDRAWVVEVLPLRVGPAEALARRASDEEHHLEDSVFVQDLSEPGAIVVGEG